MAHLIKYAYLSTTQNGLSGNLVKAQCDFCGAKFGSLEEARKCESKHIREFIGDPAKEALKKEFTERSKENDR